MMDGKSRSRRLFMALLGLFAVLHAAPAAANALDDALRAGLIGETTRGYVAPVKPPTPDVTRLVNDINQQRRAKYSEIAQKNNLTLPQVEAVAGKRIIERAAPGTFYQDNSGTWRRK